jgi:hypothetical protein
VTKLSGWFEELDGELGATVEGLSEDDVRNRTIDRGGDFSLPPQIQLDVYKEALLIFYGKVSVYLRAMGKTLPKQWQEWIGWAIGVFGGLLACHTPTRFWGPVGRARPLPTT